MVHDAYGYYGSKRFMLNIAREGGAQVAHQQRTANVAIAAAMEPVQVMFKP